MFKPLTAIMLVLFCYQLPLFAASNCQNEGIWLQVLGSGGPELDDNRASSSYIIWQNGRARILIDMGAGSMLRFNQSGASVNDLDAILISHFHVDHTNDLPALIKASYFSDRSRDLVMYGPTGNELMPSATQYVQSLLGKTGAYAYLSSYLDGRDYYQLQAHDVESRKQSKANIQQVMEDSPYAISAVAVHHGPIPALAWRVVLDNKRLIFSGDMNNDYDSLTTLAKEADLLVAHHAIPEEATGVARNLHMPPSVIAKIAANAGVKQLLLSHRMKRTSGKEKVTTTIIRRTFTGPLKYADDLMCIKP